MHKPAPEPSIADLAAGTALRRAPSSPRAKQEVRASRRLAIATTLIIGNSLICLWLLFA